MSICKAKDHIVPFLKLQRGGTSPPFHSNKRCGPSSGCRIRDHLTTCDVSDSLYSPTTPMHFAGCPIWHQLASLLHLKPIDYFLRRFLELYTLLRQPAMSVHLLIDSFMHLFPHISPSQWDLLWSTYIILQPAYNTCLSHPALLCLSSTSKILCKLPVL